MSKKKKFEKLQVEEVVMGSEVEQIVKMKFKEDKFYTDRSKPYFEKGKIYEVKGTDQIQRWLKRGGEIVEGELKYPKTELNLSEVVQPVVDKKFTTSESYDTQEKDL